MCYVPVLQEKDRPGATRVRGTGSTMPVPQAIEDLYQ